jgi:hypothetical protein
MIKRHTLLDDDGGPTPTSIRLYTQGDCWILAFELGLLLDAPLLALVSENDEHEWDHVVVDLGRETVLDVQGRASRDEITRRWTPGARTPLVLRELGRHYSMSDYLHALEGIRSATVVTETERENARIVAEGLVQLHFSAQEAA